VWPGVATTSVEPSPKDQVNVYGDVAPLAVPVNVTDWPVCGDDGVYMKLAVRVELGFVTEMVCWDVAVCCGEPPSLMLSVTVYDPADEYA